MLSTFVKACIARHGWVAMTRWAKHMHVDLHTETKIAHYHRTISPDHKNQHMNEMTHAAAIATLPKLAEPTGPSPDRDRPTTSAREMVPIGTRTLTTLKWLVDRNFFGTGDPVDEQGASIKEGSFQTWTEKSSFTPGVLTSWTDGENALMRAADVAYFNGNTYGQPPETTIASVCPQLTVVVQDAAALGGTREILRSCMDAKKMDTVRDHNGKPMFGSDQVMRLLEEARASRTSAGQVGSAAAHLPQSVGKAAKPFEHTGADGTVTHVPAVPAFKNAGSRAALREVLERVRKLDGLLPSTIELQPAGEVTAPHALHVALAGPGTIPAADQKRFKVTPDAPTGSTSGLQPGVVGLTSPAVLEIIGMRCDPDDEA